MRKWLGGILRRLCRDFDDSDVCKGINFLASRFVSFKTYKLENILGI